MYEQVPGASIIENFLKRAWRSPPETPRDLMHGTRMLHYITKTFCCAVAVWASCTLSLCLIRWTVESPGEATEAIVQFLKMWHCGAFIVGIVLPLRVRTTCIIVFALGFLPEGVASVYAIRRVDYSRTSAVHDRFRQHVISPIPKSVRNLSFKEDEGLKSEIVLQFNIAEADLEAIFHALGMKEVSYHDLVKTIDDVPREDDCRWYSGTASNGNVLILRTARPDLRCVFHAYTRLRTIRPQSSEVSE